MNMYYAYSEIIEEYIKNAVKEYNKVWQTEKYNESYKNHRDYITKRLEADKCIIIWDNFIYDTSNPEPNSEFCFYKIFSFIFLNESHYNEFRHKWGNAKRVIINYGDLYSSIKWLKKNIGREIEIAEYIDAHVGRGWVITPLSDDDKKYEVLIDNHNKALLFSLTHNVVV